MSMFAEILIDTEKEDFYRLDEQVNVILKKHCISDGLCVVYCPHTTAGITINENADPDVIHDILLSLGRISPDYGEFRHFEGNSAAHVKASLMGSSAALPICGGKLTLGTWQSIFLCEFDGPRRRSVYIKLIEG